MVISQRESSISSNIRAIIKQLNLNPVERRNYINRESKHNKGTSINHAVRKINIDVYGYNNDDYSVANHAKQKSSARQRQRPVVLPKASRSSKERLDRVDSTTVKPKVTLPEFESESLNHTAAHHRIAVRPKNRRPPNRLSQLGSPANITTISEGSDPTDDSLELGKGNTGLPAESKNIGIIRESSSRLSRTSEIFEKLEAKLPRKPSSTSSKSPDSLDTSIQSKASDSLDVDIEQQTEVKPVMRKLSNRVSKGSDIFEELEAKLPRRRSSINRPSKSPDSLENTWFSKSTDSFDKLDETEEARPMLRRPLNIDRVSKSSDSLETIDAVNSEDSIERRRSSFEFRARRVAMSKSSESFEALEEHQSINANVDIEPKKRNSTSDLNIPRGRKPSRLMSKSTESFENSEPTEAKPEPKRSCSDLSKNCWRPTKRMTVSSESSDNVELDDDLENRRARKPPKRIPSTSIVDILPAGNSEAENRPLPQVRKSARFQKSSESSELGSLDTLDSDRNKNKSSDSTETLDSLEKDLEQDRKDEEITDSVVEKREKDDAWSTELMAESTNVDAEDTKPLITDKYWRQSSESKENMDIHQLLAITIVTRLADNGNQRNSVMFPNKKLSSPPTSPKQEDNKLLFNNLLSSKNDEDLQNMLNGNISEVSTDTKSFKEKLIMFEKLGK